MKTYYQAVPLNEISDISDTFLSYDNDGNRIAFKPITIAPVISDEEIEQAVKQIGKESTAPDKDTPIWLETDIRRGINYANDRLSIVIAEQQKEIERLKEDNKRLAFNNGVWMARNDNQAKTIGSYMEKNEVADDYIDRLRAALKIIYDECLNKECTIAKTAYAALKGF